MRILKAFILSFLIIQSHARAVEAPLSMEKLRERYKGVKSVQADIVQTKSSPLLLRPLVSAVSLTMAKGELVWQVAGMGPLRIQFTPGQIPQLQGGGVPPDLPEASRKKLARTLEAVRDLLTMDERLEASFKILIKGYEITLIPLKDDMYFERIVLHFSPGEKLERLVFRTSDDETELRFKSLRLDR